MRRIEQEELSGFAVYLRRALLVDVQCAVQWVEDRWHWKFVITARWERPQQDVVRIPSETLAEYRERWNHVNGPGLAEAVVYVNCNCPDPLAVLHARRDEIVVNLIDAGLTTGAPMTPIDIEWFDAAPYPPPGWEVRVVGEHDEHDPMVVARRGSSEIVWTRKDGALLAHRGWHGVSGTKVKVDPCAAQTLRLYALGLRRVGTEEGT
jgi:hypothetical protein